MRKFFTRVDSIKRVGFKALLFLLFFAAALIVTQGCKVTEENDKSDSDLWLTTADQMALLEHLEGRVTEADSGSELQTIEINTNTTYQSIDGFGYTLTGGSAMHIYNMSASARNELLNELFGREDDEIGVSYLRVSIGSSDLDSYTFSYNDLPEGETDENMDHFSLEPDREYLIPVLQEILEINPNLKIMGSPWSAPTWMKSNNSTVGGRLLSKYYDAYALYFVKYIQGMSEESIIIDAITVQNEPLHDGNNPSMYMEADEQASFIKNHLGPAFEAANINTKIIIYDHNADKPGYPISILNDEEARQYIDGSAFHLYGGDISALSTVHRAHPDKSLYFTEQWIGAPGNFRQDVAWHTRNLIIGATRNWSRNVLEWNLAADPNQDPHTDGGCTECLGALTIDGNQVSRNPAYYIIAHASKFVLPGSVRIHSSEPEGLPNVAFKNENDQVVVIILNDTDSAKEFQIDVDGEVKKLSLFSGAVGTVVW